MQSRSRNTVFRFDEARDVESDTPSGVMYRLAKKHVSLKAGALAATGCLGDPVRASEITQTYTRQVLSSTFKTSLPSEGQIALNDDADCNVSLHIGLCRIVNGKIRMPAYAVSPGGNGAEVGSLTTSPGSINDVEMPVSKRHLLVYGDGNGNWFARGLKSTNGTTAIRGDTKAEEVIEPPLDERDGDYEPESVRIFPSDTLCLAETTQFMVVELAE